MGFSPGVGTPLSPSMRPLRLQSLQEKTGLPVSPISRRWPALTPGTSRGHPSEPFPLPGCLSSLLPIIHKANSTLTFEAQ